MSEQIARIPTRIASAETPQSVARVPTRLFTEKSPPIERVPTRIPFRSPNQDPHPQSRGFSESTRAILERISKAAHGATDTLTKARPVKEKKSTYDPSRRALLLKMRNISLAAGATMVVGAAIPETRNIGVGAAESMYQSLLTRHPQVEPLKNAFEKDIVRDGVPYFSELAKKLYTQVKRDYPKAFEVKAENPQPISVDIQPSDTKRFPSPPPENTADYLKNNIEVEERMVDGIATLYLDGYIGFTQKGLKEPLTLAEMQQQAKSLIPLLRKGLKQFGKTNIPVSALNQNTLNTGALVTNEAVMKEMVDYMTSQNFDLKISLLSPFEARADEDVDAQREAAIKRRQAYFLDLGYQNKDAPLDEEVKEYKKKIWANKYNKPIVTWLESTLPTAIKEASPRIKVPDIAKRADELTYSLLRLHAAGQINISLLAQMDKEEVKALLGKLDRPITKLQPSKLPGSLFTLAGGVVAGGHNMPGNPTFFPDAGVVGQHPSLQERAKHAAEVTKKITRRAFLIGAGATVATAAIAGTEMARIVANPSAEFAGIDRRDWEKFIKKLPLLTREDIAFDIAGSSRFFYSDGKTPLPGYNELIATQYREPCAADEIPNFLRTALTTTEDIRIDIHDGVDPVGLTYAAITLGKRGGSTLAMQLVKNVFGNTGDRSLITKAEEVLGALFLTQHRSAKIQTESVAQGKTLTPAQIKAEVNRSIVTDYLNISPFGPNIAGVKKASEAYFNKPPTQLTLTEQIFLAGLPQDPNGYNPYSFEEGVTGKHFSKDKILLLPDHPAVGRFRTILGVLKRENKVTAAQLAQIESQYTANGGIILSTPEDPGISAALNYVAPLYRAIPLEQRQQRMEVVTTFDQQINTHIQKVAEQALSGKLKDLGANAVDIVVRDIETGAIIGAYGSPGLAHTLGSVAKLVTTAVAVQNGYDKDSIVPNDQFIQRKKPPEQDYVAHNFDPSTQAQFPQVALNQALKQSYNIPFLHLMKKFGTMAYLQMFHVLGGTDNPMLADLDAINYTATIGTEPQTNAFRMSNIEATIFRSGDFIGSSGIAQIKRADKVLYRSTPNASRQTVLDPRVASCEANMLANPEFKLNSLKGDRYIAKTGTSTNEDTSGGAFNGWCAGYANVPHKGRYQVTVVAYTRDKNGYEIPMGQQAIGENTAVPLFKDIVDFFHDTYQP